MSATHADFSEASIWNRVVRPEAATFSPETSREIVALDFDLADKDRMRALSAKARAGTLTAEEDAEADHFERIGLVLNILQSKARRSLQAQTGSDAPKLGVG